MRVIGGLALGLSLLIAPSGSSAAFSTAASFSPSVSPRVTSTTIYSTSKFEKDIEETSTLRSIRPIPPPRQRRLFSLSPLFSSTLKTPETSSLLLALRSVANWASILCVLDCTLLPLLTIILPLIGWISTTAFQNTLCVWSHSLALFFVLPLGTTTTLLNYVTGHRNKVVACIGIVGLVLIGIANGDVLEQLHHGILHRIVNLVGCGLLLGSNYLGQQLGCDCGIPFCKPNKKVDPPPSAMMMQTRMVQYKQGKKNLSNDPSRMNDNNATKQ